MSKLKNNYNSTELYVQPKSYFSGVFQEISNEYIVTNCLNDTRDSSFIISGKTPPKDVILMFIGYMRYASFESIHSFLCLCTSASYLRVHLLQDLDKSGYISSLELTTVLGRGSIVYMITNKGLKYLKDAGYVFAYDDISAINDQWSKTTRENIRLHDYALGISVSSFLRTGLPQYVTYEPSVREARSRGRSYSNEYQAVRPDGVVTLVAPLHDLPEFIVQEDYPTLTRNISIPDVNGVAKSERVFQRRYFIEQDMGHETFSTLAMKINAYYNKELSHLKYEPAYVSMVFSFAKPAAFTSPMVARRSIQRIIQFIEGKEASGVSMTLRTFLLYAMEHKDELLMKYKTSNTDNMISCAKEILKYRKILLRYESTSNYDAAFLYQAKPVPCQEARMNYRESFAFIQDNTVRKRSTRWEEGGSILRKIDVCDYSEQSEPSSAWDTVEDVVVDAPSSDFGRKLNTGEDADLTLDELKIYMKESNNIEAKEGLLAFGIQQYNFWQTRTLNFCHFLVDYIDMYAVGAGDSKVLNTLKYMLWGMDVMSVPTTLAATKHYYLFPETSGYLTGVVSSLDAYIETANGIFSTSYCFKPMPLAGYPSVLDMERDKEFICLEHIEMLTRVYPRYTYTFSFEKTDTCYQKPIATEESDREQFFRLFRDKKSDSLVKKREEYLEEKMRLRKQKGDHEEGVDVAANAPLCLNNEPNLHMQILPPSSTHNPLKPCLRDENTRMRGMYHVVLENISVDISGYVRMYYLCSFVKRDTNMLLVCTVDSYTAAAKFASFFPDLYVKENPRTFTYRGLQLVFMLNSDVGATRNALFRVGMDGSIYRIEDFVAKEREYQKDKEALRKVKLAREGKSEPKMVPVEKLVIPAPK